MKLAVDLLSLAGDDVVNELVCAHRGSGENQPFPCAEFGCRSRCHVVVWAVRRTSGGNQGEAWSAHFVFYRLHSVCRKDSSRSIAYAVPHAFSPKM
jgi:hypothetical protein